MGVLNESPGNLYLLGMLRLYSLLSSKKHSTSQLRLEGRVGRETPLNREKHVLFADSKP